VGCGIHLPEFANALTLPAAHCGAICDELESSM